MAVVLAWTGAMRIRAAGARDAGVALLALVGASVLHLFFASRSLESIWLRFTTEGQESWYSAAIEAPRSVTLATGAATTVPVTVSNRGRLDWSSQGDAPFFLSYHWMLEDQDRYVVFDGARTRFDP